MIEFCVLVFVKVGEVCCDIFVKVVGYIGIGSYCVVIIVIDIEIGCSGVRGFVGCDLDYVVGGIVAE